MLPSTRLVTMVLIAAPLFLAGAVFEPFVAVGVIYMLMLAVYAVADMLILPRRGSVSVERVLPSRFSLGEPGAVELRLSHHGRRVMTVQLAENLPEWLDISPRTASVQLSPGETRTLTYRLTGRKRGEHTIGPLDVRLRPRLGLFHRQFQLDLVDTAHVFPNLLNLRRHELEIRRGLREEGIARLRQIGLGTEFESLRHYTYGDALSRIDWKATAKHSRPIVRNYQPERRQTVLIAIDTGRATAGEFEGLSRLDYLVNATLMLSYAVLRQGDWLSVMAFSDKVEAYLPSVRGAGNIDRVARLLYRLDSKLVESDYGAACRFIDGRHRKRSLICLLSDVISPEASTVIMAYMTRFARRHLPLICALSNPEIHAVAHAPLAATEDPYTKAAALDVLTAREEALRAMRLRGVQVLDVPPKALTPQLLNRYLRIKAANRL